MKKYSLLLMIILLAAGELLAQSRCGTRAPKIKPVFRDSATIAQREQAYRTQATYPLIIRLFVIIIMTEDGQDVAASDSIVYARIEDMSVFFRPHNICFVLGGIEHRRNNALMAMDVDEEEDLLDPFVREGYLTIFVHRDLWDDDGDLGGFAYGIPNNYLSVKGSALNNSPSVLAHETGHCMGLLHTFEDVYGVENVNRTGDCRDCEGDGDLLCDTPADRKLEASSISVTTCEYTGSARDECGTLLQMAPTNVMSYGRHTCHEGFTNRQGQVMRDEILQELGDLYPLIAGENYAVITTGTYSNGTIIAVARHAVSFVTSSLIFSNTAQLTSSANEIIVNPGTTFRPGAGGHCYLIPNKYCQ